MAYLNIKRKWQSQPPYVTPVDYQGLGRGVQILFNPAVGPVDLATGRVWAPNGTPYISTSPLGKVLGFDGGGSDDAYTYTGYPEITGNSGTFFMWCSVVGAADTFGHIFLGNSTSSANYFQVANDNTVFAFAQQGTGTVSWFNTTNRSLVIRSGGTAGSTKAYLDGADSGLTWSATPTSWASGSKDMSIGRYSGGTVWDFAGTMLVVGYTTQVWGAAEARAFHESKGLALYKPTSRKIWIAASSSSSGAGSSSGLATVTGAGAASSASVGSSSGLAAVSGVGASTVASAGSASGASAASGTGASTAASFGLSDGVSTVSGVGTSSTGSSGSSSGTSSASGVGASTAVSVGSSSGAASASGIGASVAESVGSSDGVATVSGVGDSSIPGSSVGSASGSSSVSGVGASIAASVGSASGSSGAVAVSDNGSLSQGGDDFPGIVIEKRRKKTLAEQPNLHLQSIIDKAAKEVLPATPKPAPTKTLGLKKTVLVATPEPEAGNPVTAINQEVIAAEAEKVAALLAQYHEQVKRMEMEEDEELLLLIMGAF